MTEAFADQIRALDPDTAQSVLIHLTARLRGTFDDDQAQAVRNESDARELLRAVRADLNIADNDQNLPPGAVFSELLMFAGQDPATRDMVLEILASPPVNRQLAVSELISDPLIIGALVTLLQTRLSIRIKSDGGKRSYDVKVGKAAADASTISAVLSRFTGPPS